MTEAKRGNVSYNLDLLLQSAAMVVKKLLVDEKKKQLVFSCNPIGQLCPSGPGFSSHILHRL